MNTKSLTTTRQSSYYPATRSDDSTAIIERLCASAEVTAVRDNLRCALAQQAMSNTALLVTAEEHCNKVAPGGKAEYRNITKAYAGRALEMLLRGDV